MTTHPSYVAPAHAFRIYTTRTLASTLALFLLVLGITDLAGPIYARSSQGSVEWTVDVDSGLERAAKEQRVVLLALGMAGESRSERHVDELYGSKQLRGYLSESVNLAAWDRLPGSEKLLPSMGDYKPQNHVDNLTALTERWLLPNAKDVIALPQHVWFSSEGEVLLSCSWEIDVVEFAWCFDEALRRAGVEERPKLLKGAHAPRRLLLGEVLKLGDDDNLGRGYCAKEVVKQLQEFKSRNLSRADAGKIRRLIFTDDAKAASVLAGDFATWDWIPGLQGDLENTLNLVGLASTEVYLPALEQFTAHKRASLRAQVAVAYEQIGSPAGLSAVKKALKKEKDSGVRANWVRALGGCGRGNASVAKTLIRLAEKEKDGTVKKSAILGLGHVLPERNASAYLIELLEQGAGDDRRVALMALALGRAIESRPSVAKLTEEETDAATREFATKALSVLDGANLIELRDLVRQVVPSDINRRRIFFGRGN